MTVRRILAVAVAFAFATTLTVALGLHVLASTLLRPDYYPEQLERADVYRFVADDLLVAVLEDASRLDADEFGDDLRENPIAVTGLTPRETADAIHRAFPPEDFEALTAPVVRQVAEFAGGDRDTITIAIDVGGRIEAAARELAALLRDSGAYVRLLERELEPAFTDWADDAVPAGDGGEGWTAALRAGEGDSLARVFRRVVTPSWLADQVDGAIDELAAYLVGRSEGFELRVAPGEGADADAADELAAVIGEADAADLVHEVVIAPAVAAHLDAASRDEVLAVLREAVPPAWAAEQADALARAVGAYATAQSPGFAVEIDLAPVRDAAAAIDPSLAAVIPERVRHTEADFRDALLSEGGREAVDALDDLREFFAEGWTYTDADLRADLADEPDAIDAIDDLRSLLSDGYVLELTGEDTEGVAEALEAARDGADAVRLARWAAIAVAVLLLAGVGLLGGRDWRGRVAWAAAALLAVAAPMLIVSGAVYPLASGGAFDAAREAMAADVGEDFPLTSALLSDKFADLAQQMFDDAAGIFVRASLALTFIGAAALAAAVWWERIAPRSDADQPDLG